MLVKLLQDVLENGTVKVTVRRSRRVALGWFQGTVIDMSDASAQKYLDAGLAEPVPAATEQEPQP